MFGMGFMEILIITIVAVIFLGPDKLPETMVNIAKFFRSMKSTVASAKESLEQEINISELKKEALSYKEDLMSAGDELSRVTSMANLDDDYDLIHDTAPKDKNAKTDDGISNAVASKPATEEAVTFEKKKKKKKEKKNEEEDNA
jgi:sec-independent protein translocase protein TatB